MKVEHILQPGDKVIIKFNLERDYSEGEILEINENEIRIKIGNQNTVFEENDFKKIFRRLITQNEKRNLV